MLQIHFLFLKYAKLTYSWKVIGVYKVHSSADHGPYPRDKMKLLVKIINDLLKGSKRYPNKWEFIFLKYQSVSTYNTVTFLGHREQKFQSLPIILKVCDVWSLVVPRCIVTVLFGCVSRYHTNKS